MNKFPTWLLVFNSISSTMLKIVTTCGLAIGSGVNYWITGREPSEVWLLFLAGLSGIDAAQFTAKRVTHKNEGNTNINSPTLSKNSPVEESEGSSDVKEISKQVLKG